MANIMKMTPQSLSMIFSMIKPNDNQLVYIVDPTYQHQYYLTPNYEQIWGRSVETSYQDLSIWHVTVVEEDLKRVTANMDAQYARGEIPLNNDYYRIFQPNSNLKWLNCRSVPLYDDSNQCIAVVGFIDNITQNEYSYLAEEKEKKSNPIIDDISRVLQNELKLNTEIKSDVERIPYDGKFSRKKIQLQDKKQKIIILSAREAQCLYCLRNGMTAKQTADRLCLSSRTVERHFENLKCKLRCQNKYQILNRFYEVDKVK